MSNNNINKIIQNTNNVSLNITSKKTTNEIGNDLTQSKKNLILGMIYITFY